MNDIIGVLARPEDPRNVGAALRACANFGVCELRLVAPAFDSSDEEIWRRVRVASAGAWEVIGQPAVYASVAEAVFDCRFVVGTTSRPRSNLRLSLPNEVVNMVSSAVARGGGYPLAVMFGCESNGLANAETDFCHALLTLPTNGEFSSLNLGQAVAVVLNNLATDLKTLLTQSRELVREEARHATVQDCERLIQMFSIDDKKQLQAETQLRRLLMRAVPTQEEMSMLYSLVRRKRK